MKRIFYIAVTACLIGSGLEAKELPGNLDIKSTKDALLNIAADRFGTICVTMPANS